MKYIIEGGKKLEGKLAISGNKNSVFPAVAAALLCDGEVILENIPYLKDTEVLIAIIKSLGVKVERKNSVLIIQANQLNKYILPRDLAVKLRGSIVLAGAILGRCRKVIFHHPGGDIIGKRSIETHLNGFSAMGVNLKRNDLDYSLTFSNADTADDVDISLEEASVTATENLILASVLGNRVVNLRNCAREPHIIDLCKMLKAMGANIMGIGTDVLTIKGVDKLHGVRYKIGIDYIEAGTYAVAAAITGGRLVLTNLDQTDLDPVLTSLKNFGLEFKKVGKEIEVSAGKLRAVPELITNIWPGFPTDLMSVAIVLATQSRGVTLCHDWMYESRMFFVDKLILMGARITLVDPHRVFIYGPSKLKGRELDTPDIRAGMALVLAALVAKGQSVISQAELIERGYENVVGKLKSLGAQIQAIDV